MEPSPPVQDNEEAPVINLQEVRDRRREEAETAERNRQAGVLLFHQENAMTEAILADRLPFAEIMDMIRLGIVTDSPERLPCESWDRSEDYYDWLRLAKDLPGSAEYREEVMRPQYPDEPEQDRRSRAEPADNHRIQCPLMAAIVLEEQPPCVEAMRVQADNPPWVPDKGFMARPIDPEDPVVKYEVRPCVLLGHHALVGMMKPVWDRQREEEE